VKLNEKAQLAGALWICLGFLWLLTNVLMEFALRAKLPKKERPSAWTSGGLIWNIHQLHKRHFPQSKLRTLALTLMLSSVACMALFLYFNFA
jgi:hypothetical protein